MPDPTFTVSKTVDSVQQQLSAPVYRPGPLWDFARGDFQRDGAGHIITATGHVAWAQRQIKRVLTRRGAKPLYRPTYGTVLDLDVRQPTRSAREAAITADIRSQLRQDVATLDVDHWSFTYRSQGRTVDVTCRITPTQGSPTDIGFPSLFTEA